MSSRRNAKIPHRHSGARRPESSLSTSCEALTIKSVPFGRICGLDSGQRRNDDAASSNLVAQCSSDA